MKILISYKLLEILPLRKNSKLRLPFKFKKIDFSKGSLIRLGN